MKKKRNKNKIEAGVSKIPYFRIRSLKFLLTYSQVSPDLSKQMVYDQLLKIANENKFLIKDYLIAHELHADGGSHYHVYLALNETLDVTRSSFFDIYFNSLVIHGKYESIRSSKAVLDYVLKGGDYLTNIDLKKLDIPKYDELYNICKDKGVEDALIFFIETFSKSFVLKNYTKILKNLTSIKSHFENLEASKVLKYKQKEYDLSNFKIPLNFKEFLDSYLNTDLKNKITVVLMGPSGIGKTLISKAIFKSFCDSSEIFIAKNKNDLKKLNIRKHKVFIMDDMDYSEFTEEEFLHLCDPSEDASLRVLYDNIAIPGGIPRIITANYLSKEFGREGIARRIYLIYLKNSLFDSSVSIDNSVKITINNTTTVNYNTLYSKSDSSDLEKSRNRNLAFNEMHIKDRDTSTELLKKAGYNTMTVSTDTQGSMEPKISNKYIVQHDNTDINNISS